MLLWQMKFKNSNSSLAYNFAVTDTASITKIFIADLKGNSIALDRMENNWQINNRYKVRNNAMHIILKTIKNISVQLSCLLPALLGFIESPLIISIKKSIS